MGHAADSVTATPRRQQNASCRESFDVTCSTISTRCEVFEVAQFSPFSPGSGEKVADRPDEGVCGNIMFEKKPPHPALSPKSFATLCNLLTTSQIRK